MKTIDIIAKEWFDSVNGNCYFSATVTIAYGYTLQKEFKIPFQYGYGSHYIDIAKKLLEEVGLITNLIHHSNGASQGLNEYCKQHGIILRTTKHENCKKKDLYREK
jgi:hypothetical protein